MKLNQLLLRENIYHIIERTLSENSFLHGIKKNGKLIQYTCYPKLNIILSEHYPKNSRDQLIKEYSLNKSRIRKIIQGIYVHFILKKEFSFLFDLQKIELDSVLRSYAIIPGNHRIRLFHNSLDFSVILLKNGENKKFINSEIELRKNINPYYAPKLIKSGDDWLIEKFVEGVPFNRVILSKELEQLKSKLVTQHYNTVIAPSIESFSKENYWFLIKNELNSLIKIISDSESRKVILNEFKNLEVNLLDVNIPMIKVSYTHGDFQEGNLRIDDKNEIVVIDWESSDKRFYLYDHFVLWGGIRTGRSFEDAFNQFYLNLKNFPSTVKYDFEIIKLLLKIEEFRFNLHEKISNNMFICQEVSKDKSE